MITIKMMDITRAETECIVNAANEGLLKGSGVSGAIFAAAGEEEMEAACRKIGYCRAGRAVITPAFRLPARYVIHAVGPYTSQPDAMALLRSVYLCAMDLVRKNGCHTVAFPLISSGAFNDAGLGFGEIWSVAIAAVRDWQASFPEWPVEVLFACRGQEVIDTGEKVLASPPEIRLLREGEKTRYRICGVKAENFQDTPTYEFIAEFEKLNMAVGYIEFMRSTKRWTDRYIVVREVNVRRMADGEEICPGKVVVVNTGPGETLPVDEKYDIRDEEKE
jgi:O-acetyl-ADP-ribose deacetylase (regulator of RNase III)